MIISKETLNNSSYSQLQQIAKGYGVKANGNREELILSLVQHFEFLINAMNSITINKTTTTLDENKAISLTTTTTPAPYFTFKNKQIENDNNKKIVGPFDACHNEVRRWIRYGSVAFYLGEIINKTKIASFDMDSTLIINKSGRTFAINRDDWNWWNKRVPDNLRQLYRDGYQIIIFTNQGGIKSGTRFDEGIYNEITEKICILEKELGIPLIAFAACDDDIYRKPNKGMWEMMYKCTNGDIRINETDSFYCGDAAGRPEGWNGGSKKDFSNTDLGFAMTIGIRFETPETHFLGEAPYQNTGCNNYIPNAPTEGKAFEGDSITSDEFELVVSVGFPASGKSTFARKYFIPAGYIVVNQDTFKTRDRCFKAAEDALKQGKSVIIDNTNGNKLQRSLYIELAKKYKANTRCLNFTTPRDLADHLNYYRERTQNIKHIPTMIYAIFSKSYEQPTVDEGFSSVTEIKFILQLDGENDKRLYCIPNPKAKLNNK